jgi:hypothetical protein
MNIAVMGVDPGCEGGVVVLKGDGAVAWLAPFHGAMTHTEFVGTVTAGLVALRAELSRAVVVEKVGVMPKDGRKGANTFGRVDGLIRGALLALSYAPIDATPMLWQAAMECLTGGNKNVTKRRAKEIWPGIKWTHNTADAALIAEYGRRRLAL